MNTIFKGCGDYWLNYWHNLDSKWYKLDKRTKERKQKRKQIIQLKCKRVKVVQIPIFWVQSDHKVANHFCIDSVHPVFIYSDRAEQKKNSVEKLEKSSSKTPVRGSYYDFLVTNKISAYNNIEALSIVVPKQ